MSTENDGFYLGVSLDANLAYKFKVLLIAENLDKNTSLVKKLIGDAYDQIPIEKLEKIKGEYKIQ